MKSETARSIFSDDLYAVESHVDVPLLCEQCVEIGIGLESTAHRAVAQLGCGRSGGLRMIRAYCLEDE